MFVKGMSYMYYPNLLILCSSGQQFTIWTETYVPYVQVSCLARRLVSQNAGPDCLDKPDCHEWRDSPHLGTCFGIIDLRGSIASCGKVLAIQREPNTTHSAAIILDTYFLKA